MLSTELIQSALRGVPLISTIEHHASIGSTNDRGRELAQEKVPEIALISADEQTAGRGRQNRAWFTPPGTALAISLLTRPAIAPQHAMRLTMLAGLAAVDGIERATGLRLDLKWPNDIVVMTDDGRRTTEAPPSTVLRPPSLKVGGILTEASFQGDAIDYAVVGLGININVEFSDNVELRHIATSLKALSGNLIDRAVVLKEIVVAFVERYAWLHDGDRLRAAWASRLISLGRDIRVQLGDEVLEGRSDEVDADGALLLRTRDGQRHRLLSGDVTLHNLNS